jgi:GH3 auxin-responsive promoter
MMRRAAGHLLGWWAARRRRALERAWRRPAGVQEEALLGLITAARDTEFGLAHGFAGIRSVAEFQERVPLRDYLGFQPLWERAVWGLPDVTWPGEVRQWVKTSGTTAGDKLIPLSGPALAAQRKGGWDALLLAVERVGADSLLGGPLMFLGGSTALTPVGQRGVVGDLSGLTVRRLPPLIRARYAPGAAAAIPEWDTRVETIARQAAWQDLRMIAGMPSWTLVFFERVARARALAGRPIRDLAQCWPNLRMLIHGGVSFAPYAGVFSEWMGRPIERLEVYPASEGWVAMQTERDGLTLTLDSGNFYEFVPVEDLDAERPRRHTVADVELGRPYAVVLTTPAGLWGYLLGDVVRFVAREPLRLRVIGRTRHFVNAFGENVIVEEVERALTTACRRTESEVVEFTVAPRYPTADEPRGGHEWLVEFRVPPREPEEFTRVLDETLAAANTDYRTKRWRDVGMLAPRVLALPAGTVHRWMREAGKLGDQHKVPRVTNDRTVAEALLSAARALGEPNLLPGAVRSPVAVVR